MIYPWKLNYWQSGEWQVVNERLKDLEKSGIAYNPKRSVLFDSLRVLPAGDVRVCIIGQDPYPDPRYATGLAFSIPNGERNFPPTLKTIFNEYCSDLGYPVPGNGDLSRWSAQGVLLWNAIPTCRAGLSLSHDWTEYSWLTSEVVRKLSDRGVVFAFLGGVAKRFLENVDLTKNEVILTSHPSPRGSRFSKNPFEGSRLFSTINDKLNSQGLEPIDWRLDDPSQSKRKGSSGKTLGGNNNHGVLPRILQNVTGASCGPLHDAGGVCIRE